MIWQRVHTSLLASGVLVALAVAVRAGDGGAPCGAPCEAPCAPATRTVCVTEWVPENYVATRTVYKTECVQEAYTAYRTECVPETRTRTVCVNRTVPEYHDVVRTCCVAVPTVETRTVCKPVVTCTPVTTVCRKCVDQGHWECQEVPCRQSCLSRMRHRKHCGDCCEPCPPPTKTVRVWVPCKVWVETPVTTMVRTCEMVPTTVQVTVCRMVEKQEVVKVCSYRCVTEQRVESFTVMTTRCVPYQATRTVSRCVPVQEQVTLCRMVPRTVEKVVPVETCCYSCCETSKKHGHRLGSRSKGCCH
jgi:hypothetical protein